MEYLYGYSYVTLKLAVGLAIFLLILRTTGRATLSQMTPLDLVSNIVMGGIIGGVIYNPEVTIYQLIITLLIWQFLVICLNFLRKHSVFFHRLIAGGEVLLVMDGKFQLNELKRLKLDVSDLATMLRIKGCALHDVAYVRLESNGDLSVIKKDEGRQSVLLVKNGMMIADRLEEIGKSEEWLEKELKKRGFTVEKLYLAEWYFEEDPKGNRVDGLFLVPMTADDKE